MLLGTRLTSSKKHTYSRPECKTIPYGQKLIPNLWLECLKNHTLRGCTYLYSPSKGVPPASPSPPLGETSNRFPPDELMNYFFRFHHIQNNHTKCIMQAWKAHLFWSYFFFTTFKFFFCFKNFSNKTPWKRNTLEITTRVGMLLYLLYLRYL